MSTRDPMWFCHECQTETRALMMPDPHCASCNSTFVEKIENTSDDPREFQQHIPGGLDQDAYPPGIDNFLVGLQSILAHPRSPRPDSPRPGTTSRGVRIEVSQGNGRTGRRTWILGGPNTLGAPRSPPGSGETRERDPSAPMTMSDFLRSGAERSGGGGGEAIPPQLMAQYLLAMLGHGGPARGGGGDPFGALFGMAGAGAGGEGGGRFGDYVFGQEALDQIITQLMENSNSSRPVPATEEIIEGLPREVLVHGSPLLEKDCAVCKEQFSAAAEEPGEQVVVTLPCTHPFHEGCILPWLKSSGTCPVCRHALIPQPEHHPPPPAPGPSSPSNARPRSPGSYQRPRSPGSGIDHGGLFGSLFGSLGGGSGSGAGRRSSDPGSGGAGGGGSGGTRGQGAGGNGGARGGTGRYFPGGWSDELD